MDLSIERSERDDAVLLMLVGRLDAETGPDLESAVRAEMKRGFHTIRLDLNEVSFLSSAGIRGLFETQRTAKTAGGTCFVSRASATVRKVLDLTRLTPILMEPTATGDAAPAAGAHYKPLAGQGSRRPAVDVRAGAVQFLAMEAATGQPLQAELIGSASEVISGGRAAPASRQLTRQACGLGIGALADASDPLLRAGELAGVCGAVFHRPPQPHAVVDYVVPTGSLQADVTLLSGLLWQGLPSGRAGFEPGDDEPSVRVDAIVEGLLAQDPAEAIAVVIAGEVQGLVGAELIRPLAEASATDSPLTGLRDITAGWLSFSREPVYARQTALIVGVACRGRGGVLAPFVRSFPGRDAAAHLHAVVFPYRPLRRGGIDLPATVADLAGSSPMAVLHLVVDPQPVLGSGCSELVRGCVWYAPLAVRNASSQGAPA
jgi:anti-anti-sigma factor